jgi:RimJ/RimL family protein N-acetyltransferase
VIRGGAGIEIQREGDRIVMTADGGQARVEALVHPDGSFDPGKREVTRGAQGEAALAAIAHALKEECARTNASVLSWEREADADWNRLLTDAGFRVHRRKIYVGRNLTDLGETASPFTWRTLNDMGAEEFLEWLIRVSEGDPFEEEPRDYKREYRELLEHAGKRLDRTLWRVALLDGVPVGLILPLSFGGDPERGTLSYVGVLPEFRGQGIGGRLHLAGLALLASAGVQRYVGSTDVRNEAMARVFARNGCATTRTRLHFRAG